jgi:hypothetical protein
MAFPTTPVLDPFTRANENPLANGSWASLTPFDGGGMKLVSNTARSSIADGSWAGSYWSAGNFGPDTEVFVTVVTKPATNGHVFDLYVRGNSGDLTNFPSYSLEYSRQAGTDAFKFIRYDVGSSTQLGSTMNQEVSNGDAIGLSVVGTTLTAWYKASGGSWASLGTTTDGTYAGSGKIAFDSNDASGAMDDFGGGTLASGAIFSPYAMQRMQELMTE